MIRVNDPLRMLLVGAVVWGGTVLFACAQNKDVVEIETGSSTTATEKAPAAPKSMKEAKPDKPSAAGAFLEGVTLEDGKVVVKGKALPNPTISHLDGGRILLKLADCRLSKPATVTGTGLVKMARWAMHGKDAHVVLVSDSGVHGKIETVEGGFAFVYEKGEGKTSATQKSAEVPKATDPPMETPKVVVSAGSTKPTVETKGPEALVPTPLSRLIGQAFKSTENGWKVILTLDSTARYKVMKLTGPDRVLVHFSNTKLDLSEKDVRKKFEGAKAKGLLAMNCRQYAEKPQPIAEVELTLAPGATFQVDRDANQVVLVVTSLPSTEPLASKMGTLGQLVSVDVDGADLRTVLKTMGQEAGYDTDISDAVSGSVTQRLKEIPLRTALAVLLTPGGYEYEVEGNLLRIGSTAYLQTSKALMPHLTEIISAGGITPAQLDTLVRAILPASNASRSTVDATRNAVVLYGTAGDVAEYKSAMRDLKLDSAESDRITRVVKLNYADPATTSSLLIPYLTPMGKVQVDARSESLVLWETANNMGVLLELIKEIDVPLQEVLLESTIVEVNISKVDDIGVRWSASRSGNPSLSGTLTQNATNSVNPGELSFGLLKSGFDVNATLSMLETHQNGKVISRPKIATLNGQAAQIQTIENVVYITQSLTINNGTSTTTTTSYTLPLPISLNVTPRITDDGKITTSIAVTITSISGSAVALPGGGQAQPPTTTQQANTALTVKNGETIVIGGLVRDTVQDNVQRIPLLGSLPVLGTLFRNTTKTTKKVELIIFITPTLLES